MGSLSLISDTAFLRLQPSSGTFVYPPWMWAVLFKGLIWKFNSFRTFERERTRNVESICYGVLMVRAEWGGEGKRGGARESSE